MAIARSSSYMRSDIFASARRNVPPTTSRTNKGRFELGRDVFYFMNEASKVEPLWEEYDDTYWKQLYKMYEEEAKENKE